ncbi:hypothetical protein [Dendrosporobacter sp. 1207_IL3150]|uniref:hypothetical protein n=1 Tax=Dendrosporobacter sp. 1207_IL3150 TaxID=3084054 RepID=UPI002FD8FEA1
MEEIIKKIADWEYIRKLPQEIHGFRLIENMVDSGVVYNIFTYINESARRQFAVVYDSATKEYVARITVGLTEYCDISYIVSDLSMLETVLIQQLEKTLLRLAVFDINNLDYIFREKRIIDWHYSEQLPRNIAGFDLYINPQQPLKIINGSYIILDYSHFFSESNLIIYYNIYRDEFFGEIRINRTPQMASAFESKTLSDLEDKLSLHLIPTLEQMKKSIK